ncbi:MAG TPA: photoactive yellow protein [Holophagaceae bacterium]|nr:photoactive yellow protein [Holophagaceae bacterium]
METLSSIVSNDVLKNLSTFKDADIDALGFGAIKLDKAGRILAYNAYESKLTGVKPENAVGRNFFTEVAPCTNVREFAGAFREGVASGELSKTFRYVFDYNMTPTKVTVTLHFDKKTDVAWVFVRKFDGA